MWRAWVRTLPFYRLLGHVVGDRAMVLPASIHSGGGDIPIGGMPYNDVIEKIKFVCEIMG